MKRVFARLAVHVCTVMATKRQRGAKKWIARAQHYERIARGM